VMTLGHRRPSTLLWKTYFAPIRFGL
jgi:hypothetical protein